MATIGIVYYSMYGNTYRLAEEIAAGVKDADGDPQLRLVDDLLPPEVIERQGLTGIKEEMADIPAARPDELPDFDGVIFGSPTRYGSATSQLQQFFDRCGALWQQGSLIGTPAGFFTGAGTIHGGHETTILTMSTFAFHMGMPIVPLGYSLPALQTTTTGGGPYGPTQWQGKDIDGLSEDEAEIGRHYGAHFHAVAAKLAA